MEKIPIDYFIYYIKCIYQSSTLDLAQDWLFRFPVRYRIIDSIYLLFIRNQSVNVEWHLFLRKLNDSWSVCYIISVISYISQFDLLSTKKTIPMRVFTLYTLESQYNWINGNAEMSYWLKSGNTPFHWHSLSSAKIERIDKLPPTNCMLDMNMSTIEIIIIWHVW